jgi:hypothetical protein
VSHPMNAEPLKKPSWTASPARNPLPQNPARMPPAEEPQPVLRQTGPAAGHSLERTAIHSASEETAAQDFPLPANPQANPFRVQAKLTVGAPDDEYEREADRVADAVVRNPPTGFNAARFGPTKRTIHPPPAGIQRFSDDDATEGLYEDEEEEEEEEE